MGTEDHHSSQTQEWAAMTTDNSKAIRHRAASSVFLSEVLRHAVHSQYS
jgi:hypothetical protein